MKLTVTKYLNARIGSPSTSASCQTYKSPGDVIEADKVMSGTEIDGNAIWFHCSDDDCYYWSGGISEPQDQITDLSTFDDQTQIQIINSLAKANESVWKRTIPGFQGYGTGILHPQSSTLQLLIYVLNPQHPGIIVNTGSMLLKGIKLPVKIVKVENLFQQNYMEPDRQNIPCMQLDNTAPMYYPGGTISEYNKPGYGSRTLRLYKKNNDDSYNCFVMTCFHVLLNNLKDQQGYGPFTVTTAGRKAGVPAKDNSAMRKSQPCPIVEGYYNSVMDFAVAQIDEKLMDNQIMGKPVNGYYNYYMLGSLLKKEVFLVGSTSYKQSGIITAIHSLRFGNNNWAFRNCLIAERISGDGDSGAPVVDSDNKLVGYVIAGDQKTETIILPFFPIFSNTKYQLKK